jgi:hypothetical protein
MNAAAAGQRISARRTDLHFLILMGELYSAWVHARLDDGESGAKGYRGAFESIDRSRKQAVCAIHQLRSQQSKLNGKGVKKQR